jgi:hypothetical protein
LHRPRVSAQRGTATAFLGSIWTEFVPVPDRSRQLDHQQLWTTQD